MGNPELFWNRFVDVIQEYSQIFSSLLSDNLRVLCLRICFGSSIIKLNGTNYDSLEEFLLLIEQMDRVEMAFSLILYHSHGLQTPIGFTLLDRVSGDLSVDFMSVWCIRGYVIWFIFLFRSWVKKLVGIVIAWLYILEVRHTKAKTPIFKLRKGKCTEWRLNCKYPCFFLSSRDAFYCNLFFFILCSLDWLRYRNRILLHCTTDWLRFESDHCECFAPGEENLWGWLWSLWGSLKLSFQKVLHPVGFWNFFFFFIYIYF